MKIHTFRVIGLMLMLVASSIAQQKDYVVTLAIMHDGQKMPVPPEIMLAFHEHSVKVPIKEGTFSVPSTIVTSDKFTLIADIGRNHVNFSDLPRVAFEIEFWTLHLVYCVINNFTYN